MFLSSDGVSLVEEHARESALQVFVQRRVPHRAGLFKPASKPSFPRDTEGVKSGITSRSPRVSGRERSDARPDRNEKHQEKRTQFAYATTEGTRWKCRKAFGLRTRRTIALRFKLRTPVHNPAPQGSPCIPASRWAQATPYAIGFHGLLTRELDRCARALAGSHRPCCFRPARLRDRRARATAPRHPPRWPECVRSGALPTGVPGSVRDAQPR